MSNTFKNLMSLWLTMSLIGLTVIMFTVAITIITMMLVQGGIPWFWAVFPQLVLVAPIEFHFVCGIWNMREYYE